MNTESENRLRVEVDVEISMGAIVMSQKLFDESNMNFAFRNDVIAGVKLTMNLVLKVTY